MWFHLDLGHHCLFDVRPIHDFNNDFLNRPLLVARLSLRRLVLKKTKECFFLVVHFSHHLLFSFEFVTNLFLQLRVGHADWSRTVHFLRDIFRRRLEHFAHRLIRSVVSSGGVLVPWFPTVEHAMGGSNAVIFLSWLVTKAPFKVLAERDQGQRHDNHTEHDQHDRHCGQLFFGCCDFLRGLIHLIRYDVALCSLCSNYN